MIIAKSSGIGYMKCRDCGDAYRFLYMASKNDSVSDIERIRYEGRCAQCFLNIVMQDFELMPTKAYIDKQQEIEDLKAQVKKKANELKKEGVEVAGYGVGFQIKVSTLS